MSEYWQEQLASMPFHSCKCSPPPLSSYFHVPYREEWQDPSFAQVELQAGPYEAEEKKDIATRLVQGVCGVQEEAGCFPVECPAKATRTESSCWRQWHPPVHGSSAECKGRKNESEMKSAKYI